MSDAISLNGYTFKDAEGRELIATTAETLDNKITATYENLNEKFEGIIQSGVAPIPVASTAGMTDHSKIYVNTTDGNWYYWSGSAWVSGGSYQSSGIAANSVNIGTFDTGLQESYFVKLKWVRGAVVAPGGWTDDSPSRCRSQRLIYLRKGALVTFTDPAGTHNWCWQSHSNVTKTDIINNSGWLSSTSFVVPYDAWYIFVIRNANNADIADNEIAGLGEMIKVYRTTPNYAGNLTNIYIGINKTQLLSHFPFTVSASGDTDLRVTKNSESIFLTFENDIEFYSRLTWTGLKKQFDLPLSIGSTFSTYGTYTDTTDITFDVTFPTNYALVLDVRSGQLDILDVSLLQPYHAILARNFNGMCYGTIKDLLSFKNQDANNVTSSLVNYNKNVKSINHRGYNTVAPENTLPAFQLSRQMGFEYVECDVEFTSDNVPVILHDTTIDRTSNGSGAINSMTYEQALQYDFGSWKSAAYTGTKIPSLEQFIQLCRNIGLHPYIEIKFDASTSQERINSIVSIVNNNGMRGKVTYISFSSSVLGMVKNADSKARLGLVSDYLTNTEITNALALKNTENEVFLDISYGSVTDVTVQLAQNAKLPVEVWTLDGTANIIAENKYVDGFTSNYAMAGKILYENDI